MVTVQAESMGDDFQVVVAATAAEARPHVAGLETDMVAVEVMVTERDKMAGVDMDVGWWWGS